MTATPITFIRLSPTIVVRAASVVAVRAIPGGARVTLETGGEYTAAVGVDEVLSRLDAAIRAIRAVAS